MEYVPVLRKVNENVLPWSRVPELNAPLSAVQVCGTGSSFTTVTGRPTVAVNCAGENAKSLMTMSDLAAGVAPPWVVAGAGAGVDPEVLEPFEPPHAVTTAAAVAVGMPARSPSVAALPISFPCRRRRCPHTRHGRVDLPVH